MRRTSRTETATVAFIKANNSKDVSCFLNVNENGFEVSLNK